MMSDDQNMPATVWPGKHRKELVQTCASVPLQNLTYLLLKKYDEKELGIIALDLKDM